MEIDLEALRNKARVAFEAQEKKRIKDQEEKVNWILKSVPEKCEQAASEGKFTVSLHKITQEDTHYGDKYYPTRILNQCELTGIAKLLWNKCSKMGFKVTVENFKNPSNNSQNNYIMISFAP